MARLLRSLISTCALALVALLIAFAPVLAKESELTNGKAERPRAAPDRPSLEGARPIA